MYQGRMMWFNHEKGYGFARMDDGRNVYIYHKEFKELVPQISVDDEVVFDIEETTKGLKAKNIKLRHEHIGI